MCIFVWLGIFSLWGVDSDGDGYSDEVENRYDWNASLADQRIRGGISKTGSETFGVSLSSGGLVKVSSNPSGMIDEYSIGVTASGSHQTETINPVTGTKRFLYWKRNGEIVRGVNGIPKPEVKENNASNGSDLVANFTELTEDSDRDGMKDWFEYQVQGLSLEKDDDPDGDGYTLSREHDYGFSPFLRDTRRKGGTSSSRSAVASVTLGNGGVLDVISDPIGLIDTVSLPMSNDDSYDTVVVNPTIGNLSFLYWERDGIILRGAGGVPLQRYTETNVGWGKTLTAKFLNSSANLDGGLPDWIELRAGGLHTESTDDTDGDGYSLQTEHKYGFSKFLADTRRRGGFSKSASSMLTIHAPESVPSPPAPPDIDEDGIADVYDLDTDGDGSTDEEEFSNGTDPDDYESFTLNQTLITEKVLNLDFSQNTVTPIQGVLWDGFASSVDNSDWVERGFSNPQATDGTIEVALTGQSHWRDYQAITGGIYQSMSALLSDCVFSNNNGTITIMIKDLKPGRYRMKTYHHLTQDFGNTKFDIRVTDRDDSGRLVHENVGTSHGTNPSNLSTREFSFFVNQQSDDINVSIGPGGDIANHMGINGFELRRFVTENPTSIDLSSNKVMENLPVGTLIGQFSGTDPDLNASLEFVLINGVGALHNHLVEIDQDYNLRTKVEFDRETISNLFLRAMVRDEYGATLEKIFTIIITDDPVEDNTAPTEISLNVQSVSEMLPVGEIVGQFSATDIDINATLNFQLLDGIGSLHNDHFHLDTNGSLLLASALDFETNQSMQIRAIVVDEYNGSLQGEFTLQVIDIFEDLDGDGVEDHIDLDDDGDGFADTAEIIYGSDPRDSESWANAPPDTLETNNQLTIEENLPAYSQIAQFSASDPDGDSLNFMVLDALSMSQSENFVIDPSGMLKTKKVFNFEEKDSYAIVVRVFDEFEFLEKPYQITVIDLDEVAPVISLIGQDIIFHSTELEYLDEGAVWNDDVDGSGTVDAVGSVDTQIPGTYELVYDFTDAAGNPAETVIRKILVVDETLPSLAYRGPETLVHPVWQPFSEPGAFAFDAVDGNITGQISISGTVDVDTPGTYQIKYSVNDSAGNTSGVLTRFVVVENRDPIDIALTTYQVEENTPIGTPVANVNFSDPDDPLKIRNYSFQLTNLSDSSESSFYLDGNGTLFVGSKLDYEEAVKHSFSIVVTDELGGKGEQTFDFSIIDAFAPIVRTEQYRLSGDGSYMFSGRIMDEGTIAGVIERGIVAAEYPDPQITDEDVRILKSTGVDDYFVLHANLDFGRNFYFRAYARNAEGTSYGASIKVDAIEPPPLRQKFVDWAHGFEINEGSYWWYSPWFGYFYGTSESGDGWFFHKDLGWIFAKRKESDGIWLWSETRNWFWTSQKVYPIAFSNSEKSWFNLPVSHAGGESFTSSANGDSFNNFADKRFSNLGAEDRGEGHWHSSWFGNFYYHSKTDVLYHENLGEMHYLPGDGQNDAWLWLEPLNWIWTSEEFYPFIYKYDELSWLFIYGDSNNKIVLFDYKQDDWITIYKD